MLDIMHRKWWTETADEHVETHQRHRVSSEDPVERGGRRIARCHCVTAQLSTATQFVRAAGHDHQDVFLRQQAERGVRLLNPA